MGGCTPSTLERRGHSVGWAGSTEGGGLPLLAWRLASCSDGPERSVRGRLGRPGAGAPAAVLAPRRRPRPPLLGPEQEERRLPHPTRPPTHTPSSVTGAGGPCHPGNMSYLSGDQQLPEGSFGGAGALSSVPCALNSCSRAPPACSIQVAGRGDSCSPDLSTNAHAPLGRTGVPGRPGPPPTWRSHPSPSSHPLLLPRLTIGGEVCGPRTQVPARQRPCAPCCVMECPLLLGLQRGQQTPV